MISRTRCSSNVGPMSPTLTQHWTNIGNYRTTTVVVPTDMDRCKSCVFWRARRLAGELAGPRGSVPSRESETQYLITCKVRGYRLSVLRIGVVYGGLESAGSAASITVRSQSSTTLTKADELWRMWGNGTPCHCPDSALYPAARTHLPYSKARLIEVAGLRPREAKPCCREDASTMVKFKMRRIN